MSTKPNYRIYDRTGGGVTHDIFAESLDDAIEQGRAWIEDGDWSGRDDSDERDEKKYRKIELACCVREIVYNSEGDIDEDETDDGQEHDCSGEYSDPLPDCEQAEHASDDDETDDEGHVWRQPHSVVGGIKENPGTWSTGGTSFRFTYVCRLCGCYKIEDEPGCQRNPGEPLETITIRDRDEDSEAWLKRTHAEDDLIPDWLAELLGCSPSTRMTEEQATEYVREHGDYDELDADDLEHAFAAIFGRRADDQDRAEGLWSHLCSAVPAKSE
jgi:hypothetical protein